MSYPEEESKGHAAPNKMTFENLTTILEKGLHNLKLSEINFK
jgi:hypothetical protein